METLNVGEFVFVFHGSPTRLEGMETLGEVVAKAVTRIGLRPALRGWKHLSLKPLISASISSPTRLEGMETAALQYPSPPENRSPTRLEGIETAYAVGRQFYSLPSPTRLEGMETIGFAPQMQHPSSVSDPP